MKKIVFNIMCSILCLSLISCIGEDNNPNISNDTDKQVSSNVINDEKNHVQITMSNYIFDLVLYENETVQQFTKLLPQTITMHELNGNEKYYYLPHNIVNDPSSVKEIVAGDVMLYGSNCLVIFYERFNTNYQYTKIGKIKNTKNLTEALGRGSISVTLSGLL